MNVTAANANAVLEEWEDLLGRCEFYTVDQEMTGISGAGPIDRNGTLAEHYANVLPAVKKYSAFQYGVCLFERRSPAASDASGSSNSSSLGTADEYIVRPFNFWLFNANADVSLEGRAAKFLLANSMDFQFWMNNGFSYGNVDVNACPDATLFTAAERDWVAEKFVAINAWYDNPPQPAAEVVESNTEGAEVAPSPAPPADEYFLDSFVSHRADVYLHYLLYAQTAHLPAGHAAPPHVVATEGRRTAFNATATKSLAAMTREPNYCRVWFHRLPDGKSTDDVKGPLAPQPTFFPFFKALVASRKPHIGHNYFTDLMFQINQHAAASSASLADGGEGALPADYAGFRRLVGDLFPTLYDTKVLTSLLATPLRNTSLGFAYAELNKRAATNKIQRQRRRFKFPLGFTDFSKANGGGNAVAHDGSYDAFMTGVVFLHVIAASSPADNAVHDAATDGRANKRRLADVMGRPTPIDTSADEPQSAAADASSFPEGIPEGYATYEGVVAQFGSKYWMAVRRPAGSADLSADPTTVKAQIMALAPEEEEKPAAEAPPV